MLLTSCRKVTEAMELKEDGKLGTFDGIGLRLHLMICSVCKHYERQRELLVSAIAQQQAPTVTAEEVEGVKSRVIKALGEWT